MSVRHEKAQNERKLLENIITQYHHLKIVKKIYIGQLYQHSHNNHICVRSELPSNINIRTIESIDILRPDLLPTLNLFVKTINIYI